MVSALAIKNASISDVAATSFEADGTGNWTFTGSSSIDTTSITGTNCYNIGQSSGSISKTGLLNSKTYIISYWTKNTSPFLIAGTVSGYPFKGATIKGWTLYVHYVTGQNTVTLTGTGYIDGLRLYPSSAQMITRTYEPLIGVITECDENNKVNYYEYEGLGRLMNIKDYLGNIVKNFQYNYGPQCTSCTVAMKNLGGTPTVSYPVGVFSIDNHLIGNATSQAQYITLWNSYSSNFIVGVLSAGADSMHFVLAVNSGQSSPGFVIGNRYYQFDLAYTSIDALRNLNGVYVDYGDGTGMFLGKTAGDSNVLRAANTTINLYSYSNGVGNAIIYWNHSYPNSSLKTITLYHNDATEAETFDNGSNPAIALTLFNNIRGNLPQSTTSFDAESSQQTNENTVASITNWNSIKTITSWGLYTGDKVSPCLHVIYVQDFMAANPNLQTIITNNRGYYQEGSEDLTFKISRLKANWNYYFTNLSTLLISDQDWSREDLSYLGHLNFIAITAANQHHSYNQTGNPLIPIPTAAIDNIINQVAFGAGKNVSNGVLAINSGGTARSLASNASVTLLNSKGWSITVNQLVQ